jgi:hypothetical protein
MKELDEALRRLYRAGSSGEDETTALRAARHTIRMALFSHLKPLQWNKHAREYVDCLSRRRDYLEARIGAMMPGDSYDRAEHAALTWAIRTITNASRTRDVLKDIK